MCMYVYVRFSKIRDDGEPICPQLKIIRMPLVRFVQLVDMNSTTQFLKPGCGTGEAGRWHTGGIVGLFV